MLNPDGRTELAVWGDPIDHSRSPALHSAAYGVLGLPWVYGRRRVEASDFDDALSGLSAAWRGLSVTMPLKEAAFRAAVTRDRAAEITGAVNTLLLGGADGPVGANTDVGGLMRALAERGVDTVGTARILGAGATAASALVALAELGAERVVVLARRPERAAGLQAIGDHLGIVVSAQPFTVGRHDQADVTIGTLPGGALLDEEAVTDLAGSGGLLVDVAYSHWPSPLAQSWLREGHDAISGLTMLIQQALLQVRIFVAGDSSAELPDEPAVLAAMRAAVVGD